VRRRNGNAVAPPIGPRIIEALLQDGEGLNGTCSEPLAFGGEGQPRPILLDQNRLKPGLKFAKMSVNGRRRNVE